MCHIDKFRVVLVGTCHINLSNPTSRPNMKQVSLQSIFVHLHKCSVNSVTLHIPVCVLFPCLSISISNSNSLCLPFPLSLSLYLCLSL